MTKSHLDSPSCGLPRKKAAAPKYEQAVPAAKTAKERKALAEAAVENNTDVRHERGIPISQSKKRATPASETTASAKARNPSVSTRIPKGKNSGAVRKPSPRLVLTNADRKRMAEEAGLTPLEFLMSMMLDEREKLYVRYDAAKAAAPYFHRKMPIGIDNGAGGPLGVYDKAQLAKLNMEELQMLERIMAKLAGVPVVEVAPDASPAAIIAAVQNAGNPVPMVEVLDGQAP